MIPGFFHSSAVASFVVEVDSVVVSPGTVSDIEISRVFLFPCLKTSLILHEQSMQLME